MISLPHVFRDADSFLRRLVTTDGDLRCPWHDTFHTGKNCYSVELSARILGESINDHEFDGLTNRVRALLSHLGKDGESWVFLPGRLGPRNLSNNVIDSGACVDVLAYFLLHFRDRISEDLASDIRDAIFKVSNTYLVRAVVEKEITNQRLWGATGLANAWRLEPYADWKSAVLASIEKSFAEQNSDGSFPYHSHWRDFPAHEGISDISPYYHSRHLAFISYALDALGVPFSEAWRESFRRGLLFLIGITRPNGIKEMGFEQKRYYWNPVYEVASNSFDLFALTAAWEIFQDPLFGHYAQQSLHRLNDHADKEHGLRGSNNTNEDFKCPIFINAQLVWALRVLNRMPQGEIPAPAHEELHFPLAGVHKLRNSQACFLIRSAKKRANITWGTLAAGGTIVFAGGTPNWENVLPSLTTNRVPQSSIVRGCNTQLFKQTLRDFFHANTWHDVRFRLWIASIEFRAGKHLYALLYPLRTIILPLFAALHYPSRTAWNPDSETTASDSSLIIRSKMCRYDGICDGNSSLERSFTLKDDALRVVDRIAAAAHDSPLELILPSGIIVESLTDGCTRTTRGVRINPTSDRIVEIRYSIRPFKMGEF